MKSSQYFWKDIKIQLVLVVVLSEPIDISIHLLYIIIELKCILTDKDYMELSEIIGTLFPQLFYQFVCECSCKYCICDMAYMQVFRQTQNDDNIFNQEKFPEPDARNKQLDGTVNILSTCWLLLEIFCFLILNMDLCFNLMLCVLQ